MAAVGREPTPKALQLLVRKRVVTSKAYRVWHVLTRVPGKLDDRFGTACGCTVRVKSSESKLWQDVPLIDVCLQCRATRSARELGIPEMDEPPRWQAKPHDDSDVSSIDDL